MPWIQENIPLAPFTTLGIGGPARYLAEISEESHVVDALAFAHGRSLPVFVLGGGSNILVADEGFPGLVLRIRVRGIRSADRDRPGIATVGAGEDWDTFVLWCVQRNWAGVECLSGIPGTAGGTPIQNVGAYGEEASEVILTVRAFDRSLQAFVELGNGACGFSYRSSVFNTSQRDRYIVLSVTYSLRVGGEPRIHYPDLQRYFTGKPETPSLGAVREAVRAVRASKAMLLVPGDPDCRSAGSFFKNPVVSEEDFLRITEAARSHQCMREGESLPRFRAPAGRVKVPAAWLIERAGFRKGYARGRAGLSTKHTLALVNRGGATAMEVLELMGEIQQRVYETFSVELTPEPVLVGFPGNP
ncbi:MAG: UDP-N-acetylenolpyruvoylglucosamine reductase [Acidobacteria bacterium]|nr:MAG: UDP-N-acetylenolpyruvoylglucosamine reductase [Acidobacteriota bacterium]